MHFNTSSQTNNVSQKFLHQILCMQELYHKVSKDIQRPVVPSLPQAKKSRGAGNSLEAIQTVIIKSIFDSGLIHRFK